MCWDNSSLDFFLLRGGRIVLRKIATIDLTMTNEGMASVKTKILIEFPWPSTSMKRVESCIKTKALISHLSLSQLPETDRPYHYLQDKSTLHGTIYEDIWKNRGHNHWLSTAEIQLLSAVLTRNSLHNKYAHVLSPDITKIIQKTFQMYQEIKRGNETTGLQDKLQANLHTLRDYIECVGDLFEHKFLLFLCNHTELHWYTFVVVNPSVIYLKGQQRKETNENSGMFAGWTVFDSTRWRRCNKKDDGLMKTTDSTFNATSGIPFFLNFCATYLYSKENYENRNKPKLSLKLKKPFGPSESTQPSENFPRFDYSIPSILQQNDTFNCGFAAVANAFAFVKHLQNVPFDNDNMKMQDSAHFLLSEAHDLRPFWEKAVTSLRATKGPGISIRSILNELRTEHEELLPELSNVYHMERKETEDLMKDKHANNISQAEQERKKKLSKKLQRKKKDEKGDCIVDYLFSLGEEHEKYATLACKKCLTSFYSGMQFVLPTKYDTIRWSLIWETPTSIRKRADLKDIVGTHVKFMCQEHFDSLCSWSLHYVQACMTLLVHAFHCPFVQCYLSQDRETWSVKDKNEQQWIEQEIHEEPKVGGMGENQPLQPITWGGDIPDSEVVRLPSAVNTLLIICQNSNHYAVMKIILKELVILVWDAAAMSQQEIEESWKVHAIHQLKMHVPEMVQEDELNILTETEQRSINNNDWNKGEVTQFVKENYKTITVRGIMPKDGFQQMDVYSCGPIAINRFASLLKECHDSSKTGLRKECNDSLLPLIKSPDELKENNHRNAAELFQHLLQNMGNAFSFGDDGEKKDKDSKTSSDGTINNPINLDDTPIQLVDSDSEDLEGGKDSKNDKKTTPPNKNKDKNEPVCDRKRRLTTMEKTTASIHRKKDRMQSKENLPKKHCDAGRQCRLMGTAIEVDGEGKNAMGCATCRRLCHNACLFEWKNNAFCIQCYKTVVVKEYDTSITFEEIFAKRRNATKRKKKNDREPTPVVETIEQYVDQYLQSAGFQMTCAQFYEWKVDNKNQIVEEANQRTNHETNYTSKGTLDRRKLVEKEKTKERWEYAQKCKEFTKTCKCYERAIRLAQDDWKLSVDGIVTALRYNTVKRHCVAKLNYSSDGLEKTEELIVPDQWVSDIYGHEILGKLVDRAANNDFVPCRPTRRKGMKQPLVQIETQRPIKRVKYVKEPEMDGRWLGMQEDGRVITLEESFVENNFDDRFVEECKKLGNNKFVGIPIGSARSSVMSILPSLHCEGAPRIKYTQDDTDSCVFKSLASAFHCTGIESLMEVANILVMRSKVLSGGVRSMKKAKKIVEEHVKWLQPKKLWKTFDWEKDMTRNMFVLAVLEDSRGSRQHAVTLFRDWIFDCNEPYALRLTKQNLDTCTWDVKDGRIVDDSLFVSFCEGWIFHEPETKKKKTLRRSVT